MTTTKQYFKVKNGLEFPRQDTLTVTDNGGPSVRPSLLLDFANSKELDPRITFTRSSSAVCYDGKSLVQADQNLIPYSQAMDNSAWVKQNCSILANAIVAPDGTTTGLKLMETTSNSNHVTYMPLTGLSGTYTFSVYAKAGDRSWILLSLWDGVSSTNKFFDLVTGVIGTGGPGTNSSITYAGNGWYRCSVTAQTSFGSAPNAALYVACAGNVTSYSGIDGSGIYVWGAQLERRNTASAYIPTTTYAITNYIPALQTISSNNARFDHDPITGESKGVLIEEQRTNLVSASQDFDSPLWTLSNATLMADVVIAPDGTLSGAKLIENTASNYHYVGGTSTILSGTTYTGSVYVKAAERGFAAVQLGGSGFGNPTLIVNLSTGEYVTANTPSATSVTNVGNGWWRITVSKVSSTTNCVLQVFPAAALNNNPTYTGDGKSGIYIWGAQLESGTFATSYIPTTLTYNGRGSSATYKGNNGLIQTSAANIARYEPNAFGGNNSILETSATNLLTDSSNLINWGGYNQTYRSLSLSTLPAPDGSLSATYAYRFSSAAGACSIFKQVSGSGTGTYTSSFYFKPDTLTEITTTIWFTGNVNQAFNFTFNPITQAYVNSTVGIVSYSITDVGGGWYRCSTTATGTNSANTFVSLEIYFNTIGGVHLWGTQLESGTSLSSYIPSVETYTGRTSTGTYYDSVGLIRTAPSGQPRYNYNPSNLLAAPKLLLEQTATNNLLYSQQAENSTWYKDNLTVTTDATVAPDGSSSADLVTETTAANSMHRIYQSPTLTAGTYTYSAFVKYNGRKYIQMFFYNATDNTVGSSIFDIQLGVKVNGIGSIAYIGNGWYRCSTTATLTVTTQTSAHIYISNNSAMNTYTGDGVSGVYIWGMQVESGYTPSSYIPTTTPVVTRAADTSTSVAGTRSADSYSSSQVTRSADTLYIGGKSFTSFYNQFSGTIYADYTSPYVAVGKYPSIVAIRRNLVDGSSSTIEMFATNNTSSGLVRNYNVDSASDYTPVTPGQQVKVALGYQQNSFGFAANNNLVFSDTSGVVPENMSYLVIGFNYIGHELNGTIKKIAYYPQRLSNSELQSITS